jgi:hypothetical protein
VAERERHAGTEVAIGELLVVTDIRPADAGCVDSNLEFANAGVLDTPPFLDTASVEVYRVSGKSPERVTAWWDKNTRPGLSLCNPEIWDSRQDLWGTRVKDEQKEMESYHAEVTRSMEDRSVNRRSF